MSFARARLARLAAVVVAIVIGAGAASWDAHARSSHARAAAERTARIAHAIGLPGLALSASSTWLRHPALASPSSAAADAPIGLDVDPAGAAIERPRDCARTIELQREAP
jgi:hypothetical protein